MNHYHSDSLHGTVSFEYANFGYEKPDVVVERIIDHSRKSRDDYFYVDDD